MLEISVKLVLAYLLGSVSGSLLVGRLAGGVDIREQGSGNAGATNALRTQGIWFALGVALIDVGKGALAASLLAAYVWRSPGGTGELLNPWLGPLCGGAAVLGHIYPVWHGFRGGKGAGTWIGAIAALASILLIPLALVWLAMLVAFGYVGLATICAVWVVPVGALVLGGDPTFLTVALMMAALITFAHRSNITRLRRGTEHQMTRAMFWRRGPKSRSR